MGKAPQEVGTPRPAHNVAWAMDADELSPPDRARSPRAFIRLKPYEMASLQRASAVFSIFS